MTFRPVSLSASVALAAAILAVVILVERSRSAPPAPPPAAPAPSPVEPPTARPAEPAPQRIELLHAVPSTVAVSSTVDNPAILPEHLVDRDLSTAWNSHTGDLASAWIAFRVPPEVRVEQIRLSAGFTRRDARGDLFTMNPRIQKVRISRAGAILLETALDPGSRSLQELPIHADGGDFRIEITELVPGSEADWREVCVSALEVWGTLPPSMTPAVQQPTVRVGSLDPRPALGIRATGGADALPLAIAQRGWAYLGHEVVDPGHGVVRPEQIYRWPASGDVAGLELRRAVDPWALPRKYRAAKQLPVVLYGARFERLCEGVLGSVEIAVQARIDELRAAADSSVDELTTERWSSPYSIVAKIDAYCAEDAHWVRSASLPPLPGVVTAPPPDRVAQAIKPEFRALLSGDLNDAGEAAAKSPTLVYVPPATRRGHGYVSASLWINDCAAGEITRWAVWETSAVAPPNLIAGPGAYDAIDGAVDIDGDGAPEIVTDMGEIADGGYIPWLVDLHGTEPPGLGCDGLN